MHRSSMPQLLNEEVSTDLTALEEENDVIGELRKRPNNNDNSCRYKRRTPLKSIVNEQCSNKVREY